MRARHGKRGVAVIVAMADDGAAVSHAVEPEGDAHVQPELCDEAIRALLRNPRTASQLRHLVAEIAPQRSPRWQGFHETISSSVRTPPPPVREERRGKEGWSVGTAHTTSKHSRSVAL